MQCVLGKEDGLTYYCTEPLEKSSSARNLLAACPTLNKAYSRMPLLRSPSAPFPWKGPAAVQAADIKFEGEAATAGQCEISVSLAKALGLLQHTWKQVHGLEAANIYIVYLIFCRFGFGMIL